MSECTVAGPELRIALVDSLINPRRQGGTDLRNLRQILEVSGTFFGGDPRLFDRRVQRWLHRLRQLSGIAVLGVIRSGANGPSSGALATRFMRGHRRLHRLVGRICLYLVGPLLPTK
jgi:hypothetical protein